MNKEKDDNAVDILFKKGMVDPVSEPVFREADWDAMEQMLDKQKKRGGIIFWLPLIGTAAAALVLLFLGWWLYKPQIANNNATQHASVAQHPNRDTGTSGGGTVQAADTSKHKILNPANYAQSTVHPVQGPKSNSFLPLSAGGSRRGTTGYASDIKRPDKKDLGTGDVTSNNPATSVAVVPQRTDKIALGTVDATANNPATSIAVVPGKPDNQDLNTGREAINNPATTASALIKTKDSSASNNVAAVNTPKLSVKTPRKLNPATRATFAISALASSDMNGVNSFQGSRVGGNFGALFSMTIKKWTFSAGAMYSIKPYQVGFSDYHTSYVFPYSNPLTIAVNCKMIDIPVNVNYQLYNKQGNKFTVGTGLSSYIILRENYTFNYANAYAQGPAGFSVINQNRNILGILNLDATYERQINSRFGIAFQPYVKLPFSNVGASQSKLQSTGIAVGLTWNINPFKK